jgi:hypothetical protein
MRLRRDLQVTWRCALGLGCGLEYQCAHSAIMIARDHHAPERVYKPELPCITLTGQLLSILFDMHPLMIIVRSR